MKANAADRPAQRSAPPLRLCQALALAILLAACGAASAQAAAAPPRFRIGTATEAQSLSGRWIRLIYEEAFRRMGLPLEWRVSPSQRITHLMDEGALDGDVLRVHGYAAAHPNQVRVEEPAFSVVFSLYAIDTSLRVARLEDLPATALLGEYRRGVAICEATLKKWLPPAQVSHVTSTEQALRKLQAGRTDFYCETDLALNASLALPEFKGFTAPHRLLDLDQPLALHPYLHKKHAALAGRLAATLAQMKAEGLIERYRLQAERASR